MLFPNNLDTCPVKQWHQYEKTDPVISVPSRNFGNVLAGLVAHFRGLPAEYFIAALNKNSLKRFLPFPTPWMWKSKQFCKNYGII